MDQIKLLVKDVLHKIQDIPDVPFTTVRMSEIASRSSLKMNTDRSASEESVDGISTDPPNNDSHEGSTPKTDQSDSEKTENSTHIFPEVIEVKNASSVSSHLDSLCIGGNGSRDSVYSAPKAGKPVQPKIIMGKKALLRSRSGELQGDPALVVHQLVHEKYQDKISHYIGRMYQRRLSRESRSTDDDGTSSNYSTNSLKTPDSLYDGKSYFSLFFPPRSETDFDSLGSADDVNKDVPTELFNSTINSTDLEYDPKRFLRNALEDVSFDSQSMDTTLKSLKMHSLSVDPIGQTSLLTRAGSLYSSVRKSLRRACSFTEKKADVLPVKNKTRNRDRCQSFSPEGFGSMENLMRELYVQNGIIFQVSKALTYCRSSKDMTSPEYVEAEKILLVASCHKEAIQGALDAAEFGEHDQCRRSYCGSLTISDVVYYLKADLPVEQEVSNCFDEYFVIVITSGTTVLSSKVLAPDKGGQMKSDKLFRLTNLLTDFEVSVAMYSMKVRRADKNHGGEVKNHKKERKVPCPSTKSFFHLNHHKSSRRNLLVDNVSSIKPSSFTLCGVCTVRCSDLDKTHFRMERAPLSSSLEGYFTASLTGEVKLTNRTCGFLTIGFEDKSHLIWNRRWCLLEGTQLKYWNYPSEEFSCKTIGVIDLTRATEKSSPADRSICPRPKSLCLLIANREGSVVKYFLSADSVEDKQGWQEEINFVIGTLDSWNCLCPEEQVTAV